MPLASTSAEPHASLQTKILSPLCSSFLSLLANIHESCLEITAPQAPALLPPALAWRLITPWLCALTFPFWEPHAPLASHHLTLAHRQVRGSPAGAARHPAPLPASSCPCQPSVAATAVSSPPTVSSPPALGRDPATAPYSLLANVSWGCGRNSLYMAAMPGTGRCSLRAGSLSCRGFRAIDRYPEDPLLRRVFLCSREP